MIQRKQTLFLLFAVIAIAICLFLPIASIAAKTMGGDTMVYNLGVVGEAGMQISTTCVPLFLLLAVSAIIALVNIFLYKNLKLQKSLCSLAMLFCTRRLKPFPAAPTGFSMPVKSHWHYFTEVLYLQEGSLLVSCNDSVYHIKPGSFILFPPQTVHALAADQDRPFRYFCIKFNLNRIQLTGSYLPNLSFAFHKIATMTYPSLLFTQEDLSELNLHEFFCNP